jgi:hypothetical protein
MAKFAVLFMAGGLLAAALLFHRAAATETESDGPQFTSDHQMLRPAHYREWVWLSSGFGMSYTEGSNSSPNFDNVFANPTAYRKFVATGQWPDKTVLVLELRHSESNGSINKGGHFQGDLNAVEVHVKDEQHFPGKWAFVGFGASAKSAKAIPTSANCYSCHQEHGAVDTTFVQFYPTLFPLAQQKNTVRQNY